MTPHRLAALAIALPATVVAAAAWWIADPAPPEIPSGDGAGARATDRTPDAPGEVDR